MKEVFGVFLNENESDFEDDKYELYSCFDSLESAEDFMRGDSRDYYVVRVFLPNHSKWL